MTIRLAVVLVTVILIVQGFILVSSAKTNSPTTDEAIHLYAGYTYVTYRDFRLNPEHPTFLKTLSGLAVSFLNPNEPKSTIVWDRQDPEDLTANFFHDSWVENRALAEKFMYQSGNSAQELIFVGRLPAILITLLLGLVIFLIILSIAGPTAGVLGLLLYATNPTVLGHGFLITTDISAALGTVLIFYALFRFLKEISWKTIIFLGLAIGFGLLTKFTVAIAVAIVLVGVFIKLFALQKFNLRDVGKTLVVIPIIWLVINAGYLFTFNLPPKVYSVTNEIYQARTILNPNPGRFSETISKILDNVYSFVRPVLAPADFYKGVTLVSKFASSGRPSYLLGQESGTGWWYYFPVILIFKHSIAFLFLAIIGIYLMIRSKNRVGWYWFSATALVLLFSMTSRANLGVRHVMPVIILGIIWLAVLWKDWKRLSYPVLPISLIAWAVLQTIISYPHYLSYFNELVPTEKRYLVARDSNLDWGQDIYKIRDYIEKNNLVDPVVEYFWNGRSSLSYFGINYLTIDQLESGQEAVIIIGATSLSNPRFNFLKGIKPIDFITPGVLVYHIQGR